MYSVDPMWPVSKDVELREDIQVLIKFWQAMLSDKKYMKYFMVAAPVDTSQLLTHGSSAGSQYTSGSSGLGPFLQVCVTILKGVPVHSWPIWFRALSAGTFNDPQGVFQYTCGPSGLEAYL